MSRSRPRRDLALTQLVSPPLVERLFRLLQTTAADLKADPSGFARAIWEADPFDRRDRRVLWSVRLGFPLLSSLGFALGVALYALLIGVEPAWARIAPPEPSRGPSVDVLLAVPEPARTVNTGEGGGGGGGGAEESRPVSKGVVPPSSEVDPVSVATTKPQPTFVDPLPVPSPLKAPPSTPPPLSPYGDPQSGLVDPSDGPGRFGGAGTGDHGGWGPGRDRGGGPGNDGGTGDGPSKPGRPGEPSDERAVATRAVILNTPRPLYTDAARERKTQGVVSVRALLGADGRVKRAIVRRGLPDGLNECAIEAVYRLRFRPARNAAGEPIDSWVTVAVTFSIR